MVCRLPILWLSGSVYVYTFKWKTGVSWNQSCLSSMRFQDGWSYLSSFPPTFNFRHLVVLNYVEVQKVEGLPWRFTKLTCTGRRRHGADKSSLDPCFGCRALHMHSFSSQHLANWHFDKLLCLGITSREGNSYDPLWSYFTPQGHTRSLLQSRPLLAPSLFAMLGRNTCTMCYRQLLSPRCLMFLHVDWLGGNISLQNTVAVENEN